MLKDNSFSDDYPLIPRSRHHAILTASQTELDKCEARQRPLCAAPTPPSAPSAGEPLNLATSRHEQAVRAVASVV